MPLPEWKNGNFSNLRNATGVPIHYLRSGHDACEPEWPGTGARSIPGEYHPYDPVRPDHTENSRFLAGPQPTPSNAFTFSQNFEDSALTRSEWTQASFRADHRFTETNSIFFRYTHARHQTAGNSIYTDPTVGQNREDDQINRNMVLSDTHTFSPTLINNLRIGAMRQSFDFQAINAGKDWPVKLGLPSIVPPTSSRRSISDSVSSAARLTVPADP